jgi:deazaflavin-dependent oxidoreductase (nitroreductase family)
VKTPPSSSPVWKLVNVGTRLNVALFRATKGRVGGRLQQLPVLLLHHVGRKSGDERVTPVLYLDDAGKLVIVASKGGTDRHPAWFHNLMAAPDAEVELKGGERRQVRARRASDEEREAYWPRLVERYGNYADYQRSTDRVIPVVVLEPR